MPLRIVRPDEDATPRIVRARRREWIWTASLAVVVVGFLALSAWYLWWREL